MNAFNEMQEEAAEEHQQELEGEYETPSLRSGGVPSAPGAKPPGGAKLPTTGPQGAAIGPQTGREIHPDLAKYSNIVHVVGEEDEEDDA